MRSCYHVEALYDYNCYVSGPESLTAGDSLAVEQTMGDTAQPLDSTYLDSTEPFLEAILYSPSNLIPFKQLHYQHLEFQWPAAVSAL